MSEIHPIIVVQNPADESIKSFMLKHRVAKDYKRISQTFDLLPPGHLSPHEMHQTIIKYIIDDYNGRISDSANEFQPSEIEEALLIGDK